jgi:SAM-dependent methyltransferase
MPLSETVTGERVVTSAGGFNPTWQRHVAAYAAAARWLPPRGRVLDLGCGIGHSYRLLDGRETVGVDCEPAVLASQDRETAVADMRALPFEADSFDALVSVQSIEHVPDPARVLGEAVRVLRPGAPAFFATPNRLTFAREDEIIDPYHYIEYDADQLAALLRTALVDVRVRGLFGSQRHLALVAAEHRRLDALLRCDPLRLRRLLPRRARQRLYDWGLSHARRNPPPGAGDITPEDFWVADADVAVSLDLVGTGRTPG